MANKVKPEKSEDVKEKSKDIAYGKTIMDVIVYAIIVLKSIL